MFQNLNISQFKYSKNLNITQFLCQRSTFSSECNVENAFSKYMLCKYFTHCQRRKARRTSYKYANMQPLSIECCVYLFISVHNAALTKTLLQAIYNTLYIINIIYLISIATSIWLEETE